MKRVLITGATGFIGRHCLPLLLSRGYEIHAVSSAVPADRSPDIRWHHADLLEPGQIPVLMAEVQPTHLLHLAWYTEPHKYWTSLENVRWLGTSLELLLTFAKYGGQRVVVAGTCAEYDWRYGYCSEYITPLAPTSLYGTAKHSLNRVMDAIMTQAGLSGASGRLFFLYGPYERPERLVPMVIRSLLKGEPALCSPGSQVRDFLYVKDAARAFVELVESNVTGAVNVASGRPIAVKDVVTTIADRLHGTELIRLGALPAAAHEPHLLVADVGRLTGEVDCCPEYELDRGLEETIAWWKSCMSEDQHELAA